MRYMIINGRALKILVPKSALDILDCDRSGESNGETLLAENKKLPKAVKPRKVYLFKMSIVESRRNRREYHKVGNRYQPEYTDCIRIGYLPSSGEPQCFKACYRGPCAVYYDDHSLEAGFLPVRTVPVLGLTICNLGSMCLAAVTSSPLIPSIRELSSSITGEVYSIIKSL